MVHLFDTFMAESMSTLENVRVVLFCIVVLVTYWTLKRFHLIILCDKILFSFSLQIALYFTLMFIQLIIHN